MKFHEDPSFRWGDICKTILVFFNRWFSMYFSYFPNYAPPKPSDMDNYWILMNFFWNYISKCTYLMNKRTPVSVYRLFSSLSNKQILFDSFKRSPCMIRNWDDFTLQTNQYIVYISCSATKKQIIKLQMD